MRLEPVFNNKFNIINCITEKKNLQGKLVLLSGIPHYKKLETFHYHELSVSTSCMVKPVAFAIFSIDKPITSKLRAVSRAFCREPLTSPSARPSDFPSARPRSTPALNCVSEMVVISLFSFILDSYSFRSIGDKVSMSIFSFSICNTGDVVASSSSSIPVESIGYQDIKCNVWNAGENARLRAKYNEVYLWRG